MEHLCPTAVTLVTHSLGTLSSSAQGQEPGASLFLGAKVCWGLVRSCCSEFVVAEPELG